jgi:hypothetical protein
LKINAIRGAEVPVIDLAGLRAKTRERSLQEN